MATPIHAHAERTLARTETELADRLAALQSAVAQWTPDRVHNGELMTAASALTEIAALSARAAAQREAVALLEAAENA